MVGRCGRKKGPETEEGEDVRTERTGGPTSDKERLRGYVHRSVCKGEELQSLLKKVDEGIL